MACCHKNRFKVKVSKMGMETFTTSFMMKFWQHLTNKGRFIPHDEVYCTLTILAPLYKVHYIGLPVINFIMTTYITGEFKKEHGRCDEKMLESFNLMRDIDFTNWTPVITLCACHSTSMPTLEYIVHIHAGTALCTGT